MGEGTWPRHLQTRAVGSGGLEWASWQSGAAVPSLGQRAGGSAVCRLTHPQSPWGKALELAVPGHRSLSLWGLAERWQQAGRCMPWEAKATSSTSAMPAAEVGRRQGAMQGWCTAGGSVQRQPLQLDGCYPCTLQACK